jgi:hypothetical protein
MKRQSLQRSVFTVLLLVLLGSCSIKAPVVDTPPEGVFHVVTHRGETLGIVSAWFTGKSGNWREIQQANPELNPDRIDIGDTVFIPKSLLVREDDLPLDFVRKYLRRLREKKKFVAPPSQEPQGDKSEERESIGLEEEPTGGEREELLSDLLM